jgi:excisionase family DNA binding protein
MTATSTHCREGRENDWNVPMEPLIDTQQAARLLGIHPVTLREMAKQKKIPGIQIGRVWRFRVSTLNAWIATQECRS